MNHRVWRQKIWGIYILGRLNPLIGSSHIPLRKKIVLSKAVVNMKNDDNKCFKWVIARATHPVPKHADRVTKELRKQAEELNWYGIQFATPCSSNVFKMFEKSKNISRLVFAMKMIGMTYVLFLYAFRESDMRKLFDYHGQLFRSLSPQCARGYPQ